MGSGRRQGLHDQPQAERQPLVQLSPAQSLVLVTGHTGATPVISGAYSPMPEGNKVMELSGPWSGGRLQSDQRGNPNAMTLTPRVTQLMAERPSVKASL